METGAEPDFARLDGEIKPQRACPFSSRCQWAVSDDAIPQEWTDD
jgi:hypothetical protein